MNLLLFGEIQTEEELKKLSEKFVDDYEHIILAIKRDSLIKIDKELMEKYGFLLHFTYNNVNELEFFEQQQYVMKSIKEVLFDDYDYKFSIIIPVYNTQEYIKETVNSVIKQTIGFENIQLILVNDGSKDNSGEILARYAKKYPNNIKYINKINEGVSIARNTGLKYAKGKYINFLDSDDKWGLSTLENVYNFFEDHPLIDVVSCRLSLFDSMTGEHPLNYKFEKKVNKIVDLKDDYNNIQMHAASSFFRHKAIKDAEFDSTLKYAEDAKFVYQVLKNTYRLGLMSYIDGCYWYRKRADESSAIDTGKQKTTYYLNTLNKFHMYLVEDNLEHLPKYVQIMIMYDLQYRLNFSETILDDAELKEYINKIKDILLLMDDDIIMSPILKHINPIYQIGILTLKHGGHNFKIEKEDDGYCIYSNNQLIKKVNEMYLKTEYLYEKKGFLKVGYSLPSLNNSIDIIPVLVANNSEIILPNNENIITEQYLLNEKISDNKFYSFQVELNDDIKTIEVKYLINGTHIETIKNVGKTLKTNFSNNKIPYKRYKNRALVLKENKIIKNTRYYLKPVVKNVLGLFKSKKTRKSALYKLKGISDKKKYKNETWLFIDRLEMAGDNAEALFRYVVKNHPEIDSYFIINATSSDYIKLKKEFGKKVVAFNSHKHHLLMFRATKVLTSHSEAYLNNPFGVTNGKYIRELLDFDFIFLQHGVIQTDLSPLLNKMNKPMDKFITSSSYERNDILKKYGFSEEEVILTGLPRFDLLNNEINKGSKVITFMPTWRPQLLNKSDAEFLKSDFYMSIFNILTSDLLKHYARFKDIKIELILHPKMKKRFSKFFENIDYVTIPKDINYKDIISKTSLLITDISSIAFDVAYLEKPIIYYHFDINDIYENSAYNKGYFDFENLGFGPIVSTPEELKDKIQKVYQNNFKITEKYKKRINDFFIFNDHNNCKRIVENIYK